MGKLVNVSRMNLKFVDLEECNNFDEAYLLKDLYKTIAENAPTLEQIDSLQGIHFCPHTKIWPLEHLRTIKQSLAQEISQNQDSGKTLKYPKKVCINFD